MISFVRMAILSLGLAAPLLSGYAHGQNVPQSPATVFFQTLNDVPVMPGLRELTDEGVNFDKPEGRIMTATAVSETLKPEAIQNFYRQTLPQLGWVAQPGTSFLRDRERLRLNIEVHEGVSVVHLQVEPR